MKVSRFMALGLIVSLPVLSNPVRYDGELSPEKSAEYKLALKAQDYVKGQFTANVSPARVELIDEHNQPVRLLVGEGVHAGRIIFVAENNGNYTIRVTAKDEILRYQLDLSEPISKEQQVSPPYQPESPTLARLQQTLKKGGTTDAFWQQVSLTGAPLIEKTADPDTSKVTFLWRGAKKNVRLFGAPFGGHQELKQLADSDVWYKTYDLPVTTRLSYQLAPDVPALPGSERDNKVAILATAQQDPLNPGVWQAAGKDKYNTQSVLQLDGATGDEWLTPKENGATGKLSHHTFKSYILGNTRQISVYTPDGIKKGQSTPTLVLFDSKAYQTKVPTMTILDNLIAEKRIPPTRAIFIANPSRASRNSELPPNQSFADFMAKELMPWFENLTETKTVAENVILSGSSYGGLASSWVALRYPDTFGAVLSQSGSYWWGPDGSENEWLSLQYALENKKPLRFYLNAGVFETGLMQVDILESNRHFHQILIAKGYDVKLEEVAGGHDYFSWRVHLASGLIHLLGKQS